MTWPRRLAWSRTHAFHACNTGSNPVGVTRLLAGVIGPQIRPARHQGVQMDHDAAGQDRDVVAPFEHADDSPLGVGLGDGDDLRGQVSKSSISSPRSPTGSSAWASNPALIRTSSGRTSVGQRLEARAERGVISLAEVP